jgi:hypothetical protein
MENQESVPQWAVIELMGHVRYGGLVSKDNQFGTAMLCVDVPQENGSFVTQLVNPTSIYRLTICSESIGRAAAKAGVSLPMRSWELEMLPLPEVKGADFDMEPDTDDDLGF